MNDTHGDPFWYERIHRDLAAWLNGRGVTAIFNGTGGNNYIVVVDAPAVPAILAYTPGGEAEWGAYQYPRRADGDAYRAFWEHEGLSNADGNEPADDAPVGVVGAWILNQIATYRPPATCPCPDHSNELVEADACLCIPACIRFEAWPLDFSSREAMVAWLIENDPNGAHSDEDATRETGKPHTLASALACYRSVMDLPEDAPEADEADYHSLMRWLIWEDPDGPYTDADRAARGLAPATLAELQASYRRRTLTCASCCELFDEGEEEMPRPDPSMPSRTLLYHAVCAERYDRATTQATED